MKTSRANATMGWSFAKVGTNLFMKYTFCPISPSKVDD
jgi:hypothetical protein